MEYWLIFGLQGAVGHGVVSVGTDDEAAADGLTPRVRECASPCFNSPVSEIPGPVAGNVVEEPGAGVTLSWEENQPVG